MKISELTELVYLINPVTTTDIYGGVDVNTEVAAEANFYAKIVSNRSGTYTGEGNTSELETWTCTIRKNLDIVINLKKLILWNFQKYAITSVKNIDEGKVQWQSFVITKLNV